MRVSELALGLGKNEDLIIWINSWGISKGRLVKCQNRLLQTCESLCFHGAGKGALNNIDDGVTVGDPSVSPEIDLIPLRGSFANLSIHINIF